MLSAGPDARRRRRALAALSLAALAAHLLLIGGVELAPARVEVAGTTAALQVRTIVAPGLVLPEPPVPSPAAPLPAPKPAPSPPQRPVVARPPEAVPVEGDASGLPSLPVLNSQPLPLPVELEPSASAVTASEPAPVLAVAAIMPAASAVAEDAAPPLYTTRLPPPVMLRYELRRGPLSGSGDLLWRPHGDRYELSLQGSVVGVNVLKQVSDGALDANGLAPQRFTDQRARRAAVAANFEREAGRIRFSGPSHEVPWQPGVQDRLSWMVQLAAVAAAQPARLAAGERIVLQVVGARGDASVWAFRSEGVENLTLFSERVETVKLLREPRSAYDTRVEVWLDPARHHLPVRATLGSSEDDRLELRLREMLH